MGINKKPRINDYWSSSWFEGTSPIKDLMTRERFYTVLRSLMFTRERKIPGSGDRLYRIRNLINMLNTTYAQNYYPHEAISVDESLVKYKGVMTKMKVKMDKKAARVGFKQYKLNCAESSYCVRAETYSNSLCDDWKTFQLSNYDLRSFTDPAKVVLFLIKPYLGYGHTVGLDQWFSEPRLFRILLEEQTNCIGTMQDRRNMPKTAYKNR